MLASLARLLCATMAGRFDLYETQMSEQEDQARVIMARDAARQNMREAEVAAFSEARAATAAAAAESAVKVIQPQPAKASAKPKKPSLPSCLQAVGVKRAAPAAAASADASAPAASASPAPAAAAEPNASAEVAEPSAAVLPAKVAKKAADDAPGNAIASLLGYSDSDDEDDND